MLDTDKCSCTLSLSSIWILQAFCSSKTREEQLMVSTVEGGGDQLP